MDYKITLNSNEVPKEWYNINADLPCELPMPQNSEGKDQIASLQKAFTKANSSIKIRSFSSHKKILSPS